MRFWKLFVFVTCMALIIGLSSCASAPKVDWTLTVSGAGNKSFSYADLVAMPQTDLTDILMEKSLGEDETASWSGVALQEIFTQAGVTDFSTVTATAADGYAIEISKDELEGGIVALKKDGDWITKAEPDKGPIRLVCPETPANRWVFQVQELTVNP
ncbi:MAG: molybdopterin-dependent oxidoreductase [Anaerolineae bacterium]|nr:molybdopterin-dependent oxidoreductase [Anaerolineae bacterium]